jgi:hypothetical protein
MRRRRFAAAFAVWAIPVCALATIGLGLIGWMERGFRFDEALYRAVTLLGAPHDYYHGSPGSTDWRFLVGRWTGLLAVFGATLLTVGALLRERVLVGLAQQFPHRICVVGANGLARAAYEATIEAGKSVVWVGASAMEAATLRALAMPWPQEDHVRAIRKYAAGSDHVLLSQDDDAGAIALADAARAAARSAFVTVLMENARLAEDAAEMISHPRTRVLSTAALSARALHAQHAPFLLAREAGHRRIHALVVGFGETGQAIAGDLIVNCRTTFLDKPCITVIDPDASALEGVMRVRAPELDECAQFRFVPGAIGTLRVEPDPARLSQMLTELGPLTLAYVCLPDDSQSLSAAGMLQSLLRAANLPIPDICVNLRQSGRSYGKHHGGERTVGGLIPFGDLESIAASSEFLSDRPDRVARAYSEAYRALLTREQRRDRTNRSAYAWDELDETFRRSTRYVVAHIAAKMASGGVPPEHWLGVRGLPRLPPGVELYASRDELEALAALEHERWCAQRRMDGWRLGTRDDSRRRHPMLVAYADLPVEAKGFDRAIVEETQKICAHPGGQKKRR